MSQSPSPPVLRLDVIRALRDLAASGATVSRLVEEIRSQLGHPKPLVIPVLVYFTQAFHISLPEALPLREWIGSADDAEINAVILPAIERTRVRWMSDLATGYNGSAGTSVADPGVVTCKPRS